MSRMRVMVVDEHEGFRQTVTRLMTDKGFEAYPAADGIDALRQIYQVMPQLIVSDADLADLSGFEFLPFVKRRFPSIGVIVLGTQPRESRRTTKFVADMLLPKQPWDATAFLGSVDELLSRCPLPAGVEDTDCA
jgi:chemosensory pili system protein ChpA (sensor histidine kinase/response regulator)